MVHMLGWIPKAQKFPQQLKFYIYICMYNIYKVLEVLLQLRFLRV